jgi:hypothetical protein
MIIKCKALAALLTAYLLYCPEGTGDDQQASRQGVTRKPGKEGVKHPLFFSPPEMLRLSFATHFLLSYAPLLPDAGIETPR